MGYFKETDGLRYFLEKKENGGEENQFPAGFDSFTKTYTEIEQYLNRHIHRHVNSGAAAMGSGLLTDHGEKHVATVILRATSLVHDNIENITGYEIFILLLAIHFHDVGNIMGREKHEEKIFEIIDKLPALAVFDFPVKRVIAQIAMAHGGYVDEETKDKDTISRLDDAIYLNGLRVRVSMLAAILRFADELADDKTRIEQATFDIGSIPKGNQIYHLYSKCLQPPVLEGDTIKLEYYLDYEYVINQYYKGDSKVYLYDEILERISKCLCELEYCKRFCYGFIKINAISARIVVIGKNRKIIYDNTFKTKHAGYPNIKDFDVRSICVQHNGQECGEQLKKIIEEDRK